MTTPSQSVRWTLLSRIPIIFAALLVGCATTPAPSFSELLVSAEALDDATVVTATALLNAGSLSSAQARKILSLTDAVNAALSLAQSTYAAGNTASASAKLTLETAILTALNNCLRATPVQSTIDACTAAVGNP